MEQSPSAYIEGPFLYPRYSYANMNTEVISVHFRPAMLEQIISVPVSELSNYCIPLSDFSCSQLALLTEDVMNAPCVNAAIKLIELRIMRLLTSQNIQRRRKAKPLWINSKLINQTAKELAATSGLSIRQLERRFMASYGVTIRDWRRLDRATKAITLLAMPSTNLDITTVAYNANYFDHSHMCRDFRKLCGVSPQEFSRRLNYDPAYWPIREFRKLLSLNVASVQ
ncbi:MAG: helix-turn-helix transcriptional regulator [Gammaproteobacteria bacterium]|nr:helix-turn-helix transcriptional regulator [Gammaproteobacteria bacterium]